MRFRFTNSKKERRELGASFLLSVLAHLLLLLLFLVFALWIGREGPGVPPLPPDDEPMELTILPPPPAPPEEPPPPMFVDTTGMEQAAEPPEDARFESDMDTTAASETVGAGDPLLPSLEGRDDPAMDFVDQQFTLGPQTGAQAPSAPSPPQEAAQEQQQEQQQETAVEPVESPPEEAVAEVTEEGVETEEERVIKELPPPPPDAIALREAPKVRRAQPVAPESVRQEVRRPEAVSQPPPGYQPERRTTRIEGGVSNRGRTSVTAMSTPLGRYKKMLSDAIGSRWYFYVSSEISLLAVGTTTIRFNVFPDGRVSGVQILSNSSNESFASVSIRSILEADIPPIPPEVAEHLENNRIEVDYTFSILAN